MIMLPAAVILIDVCCKFILSLSKGTLYVVTSLFIFVHPHLKMF